MPLDEPDLTVGGMVWPDVWEEGWWGAWIAEPALTVPDEPPLEG